MKIAATILLSIVGVASLLPLMMLPMLFDAPGSTADPGKLAIAATVISAPVACGVGVFLVWRKQS